MPSPFPPIPGQDFAPPTGPAYVQIPNLPLAIAIDGTEQMEAVQSGASVRITINQIEAFTLANLGIIQVPHGGTGRSIFTPNGVVYGNGTNPLQVTAQGPINSVLTANAGAPVFSATPTVTSLRATTSLSTNQYLLTGSSSGTISILPQAVSGTYHFNLPTTAGPANHPLLSGGGGAAPMIWGNLSGNTTTFATTSGVLIAGHAASFDASGNIIDSGSPPAGSVNPGLINQLAWYAASGNVISGLPTANNGVLITSGAGVPSISSTLPTIVQGNITTVGVVASGTWQGTPVTVPFGGTGDTTFTLNGVVFGNGASPLQVTAQGGANTILVANAGAPSFSAAPTIGTSVTTPLLIGGVTSSSTLTLESTSGVGTTDSIVFKTGSQVTRLTILSAGSVTANIGFSSPLYSLTGSSSGTISILPQAAAGTYNFNLPITSGTPGQPLISGGGGATAMGWGSLSGNTTTFATTSGVLTSGHAAIFDASGNIIDGGVPSSGSVNPGLVNQVAWYASTGSTVSGLATVANGVLVTNVSSVPSISTTLPSLVQTNITELGIINTGEWQGTTVAVPFGGTGDIIFTTNGVLFGNGINPIQSTNQGGANTILVANSGPPSFSAAPTIGTSVTTPLLIGGTIASSTLTLESTSAAGATDSIVFKTGSQVTRLTIASLGTVTANVGFSAPLYSLTGSSSGTISILAQAAAGTYDFNLPTTPGIADQPLLSGGGGGAPMIWGSLSGNTTTFGTTSGTLTATHIAIFDAFGNLIDGGSPIPGGTVNPGTVDQLAWYASTGSTISGLPTANNGVLVTSGGGVPSISSTLPTAVQGNITTVGVVTSGTWQATPVTVPFGGTGDTTFTLNGVVFGNGTSPLQVTAQGGANTVLVANAGAPSFSTNPTVTTLRATTSLSSNQYLLTGATSGTISILPQAVAGTYNFNLPITAGTLNQPLISGGGGATAMSWGTLSGNTSTFATTSGTLTSGHAAIFDASGNIVDGGTPSTGNVSPGTINQLAWYAATGSTVSGLATANNGVLITSGAGVPSISSTLPTAVQGNITTVGVVTSGTWQATPVTVPFGGTGDTTFTLNGVVFGNGASALQVTAQGPANSVLTANAGAPSFSASPTIGTSVTTPLLIGGTAASSTLTLESTSGVGTTDSIIFKTGSQVTRLTIASGGTVTANIGFSAPLYSLTGSSSGTISILPQAAAGTYNFNLPTTSGTAGQPLLSGGGGATAMTFGTLGVAGGGTGDTTFTLNGVVFGNGASPLQVTAQGIANSVLTANAGAPSFSDAPTIGTSVTTPRLIGGTTASSSLIIDSTSGVGTTDAILFRTGSQVLRLAIASTGLITANIGFSSPLYGLTGSSSGTISILGQAAAGTYNFNLPINAGTSGQPLLSGGGGATAMTFGTLGVAGGGTGDVTFTLNGVLFGNGASAIQATAQGAANTVLVANAGAPSFSTNPTVTTLTATTSVTTPEVIGGTTAASTLRLESTSGAGTTDFISFFTGSQVEHARIDTAGNFISGSGEQTASPTAGTIRGASAAGGNRPGANLTIQPGDGTGTGGSGLVVFQTAPAGGPGSTPNTYATAMNINNLGGVGIGGSSATAWLNLRAGTATAGQAPLKFPSGTVLTTPETGAMEYGATSILTFTPGVIRRQLFYGNLFEATPAIALTTATTTLFSVSVESGFVYFFEFNFQVTPVLTAAIQLVPTSFTTFFANASTFVIESYTAVGVTVTQTTTASASWNFAASTLYGRIRFSCIASSSGTVTFGMRTNAGTATLDVGSYTRITTQ